MFPLNLWVLKSKALTNLLMAIAFPGFALVLYVHKQMNEPIQENIAPIAIPLLMAIASYYPSGASSKSKKGK